MEPGQIAYPGIPLGSTNQPTSLNLQSGAIWLPPAGAYYAKLGPQSALQWLDINTGFWRTLDSGYSNHPIPFTSDGTNFRVINLSGTISGIGNITAGSLYNQANATMTFGAPAAGTPSITATCTPIVGGSLTYTVTAGGTGYVNPIFIVPPPQLLGGTPGLCIPATIASCTLTSGVISSPVSGFAGAGYQKAPGAATLTLTPAQFNQNIQAYLNQTNIIIIDPAGSGAIITPALANGTSSSGGITGCVMTNLGAGYDGTHIPTVTISGTTGSGASATALPNMALKSVTVGGTNTGYTSSVMVESSLSNGTTNVSNVFDEPMLPRRAIASAAGLSSAIGTMLIEDAGSGFQTVPLLKQVGNATSDGSVNATFTAVVGGVNNILLYWQIG